eukprot:947555-Alexandrium_andersonii.AAC.1
MHTRTLLRCSAVPPLTGQAGTLSTCTCHAFAAQAGVHTICRHRSCTSAVSQGRQRQSTSPVDNDVQMM